MSSDFGSDRTGDDLEQLCCDTIRVLAMDAVEKAGCGHPGMPMGAAEMGHVLWTQFLNLDPSDPGWIGRDRFILSAGHGSMLVYSLLHLGGFPLTLEDLQQFRQANSHTPGHPENFETPGVETTTGPLGQGISNGVGMALANAHLKARFPQLAELLDHKTYVIAGDGDLMEGVSHEACSLAGHLRLKDLIVLYDDNEISIDGRTDITFSEDVLKRFESYGWAVSRIDGHDRAAIAAALEVAKQSDKPVLIACRTVIGKGAPNKQDTSGVHGSKLGPDELKLTKENLGWPETPFLIPGAVKARWEERQAQWRAGREAWNARREALAKEHGDAMAQIEGCLAGKVDLSQVEWPSFEAGKGMATRNSSGKVLNAISPHVPQLIGGSADLTGSVKTYMNDSHDLTPEAMDGRNLRYGVREHGMAAAMNGMALYGGLIPFGGTFLVFSDYNRPSIRLAALMNLHLVHVLTHDSVFLGEDGPTHQPIEHYMALRAIPRLEVWRPGDANEVAEAWRCCVERKAPHALILSRQDVATLDRASLGSAEGVRKGGYTVLDCEGEPAVILMATGSELPLAVEVGQTLQGEGTAARVVSLPCWEVFAEQPQSYQDEVLPPSCTKRVSIESGVTFGWQRYTGAAGLEIGIDRFGASAPLADLLTMFGFTSEQVLEKVRAYLS